MIPSTLSFRDRYHCNGDEFGAVPIKLWGIWDMGHVTIMRIVFLNDGRACIFPDIIIETIGNITDEAVQKYIKEQAEESRKEDSRSTAL